MNQTVPVVDEVFFGAMMNLKAEYYRKLNNSSSDELFVMYRREECLIPLKRTERFTL